MLADELPADVPLRAGPARGGVVERVDDAEGVWVRAPERGELVAEEDVGFGHVGVEQREARFVGRVAQRGVEELVERRDSRAAAYERHVLVFVRCVCVCVFVFVFVFVFCGGFA